MNAIRRMTNSEMKALDHSIKEQIRKSIEEYTVFLEATYLWHRHVHDGHGLKRLENDLESFAGFMQELKNFYELEDSDGVEYLCLKELKDIGFDISKLGKTIDVEYSINGRKGESAKWSRR